MSGADRSTHQQRIQIGVVGIAICAGFAVQLIAILARTQGHFTYSLDDPYIHLRLAEQIRSGHYGINPGEVSSPSSSPLWPFLLALVPPGVVHQWSPLVVNFAATLLTGGLLVKAFALVFRDGRALVVGAIATLFGLNIVGVAFTGMEHSVHITATLAIGLGVASVVRNSTVPTWLPLALVVAPLIRYEGAAVALIGAAVLFARGYRRVAVLSTLVWALALAGFSIFLAGIGLDVLPNSVLAKSSYSVGSTAGSAVLAQVIVALLHIPFLLAVVLLGTNAWAHRRIDHLHGFALLVLAAHGVAGSFGWWGRYELYVYAAALPAVLIAATEIVDRCRPNKRRILGTALACLTALAASQLISVTVKTPLASAQIWHQQAQTAEFVRAHWSRAVAVNDLGLVAYRGDEFVLDLWGLASNEALDQRLAGDPAWPGQIVEDSDVQLAAVFNDWFDELPATWTHVGTLSITDEVIGVPPDVHLYATRPSAIDDICTALNEFARQAPTGTTVVPDCAA